MSLLWIALGFGIGLVVHEFGHAVAGWLVGIRIKRVTIGQGPAVLRGRLGGAEIAVNTFVVLGGSVESYPIDPYSRWRDLVFTAGGVLANMALVLALLAAEWCEVLPDWAASGVGPVMFAQGYFILLSMIPMADPTVPGAQGFTDADIVLHILRRPK